MLNDSMLNNASRFVGKKKGFIFKVIFLIKCDLYVSNNLNRIRLVGLGQNIVVSQYCNTFFRKTVSQYSYFFRNISTTPRDILL